MELTLLYHQFIRRGGLEGYLYEFARQLHDRGHQLTFVASRYDARFQTLATRVRRIWTPPLLPGLMLAHFARRSAQILPQLGNGAVLGFGRTYKQDVHRAGGGCHAVYSRLLSEAKQRRWKNQLELRLERTLYTSGQTPQFVVNATRVQEEIHTEYGVSADRIHVIPTGVDTAHFAPADQATARAQLGVTDLPTLLFVSLDHHRKGLETALQAICRLPEVRLWIVGSPLNQAWEQRLHTLGLTARVTSFGPQADLRPYYQAADVFVHPTRYDACANTVLQSMASGLPGVISSHDGARDFIQPQHNGYLLADPTDAEELAQHIQATLQNRPRLSAAARATMLPLTWARHVEQWLALLTAMGR